MPEQEKGEPLEPFEQRAKEADLLDKKWLELEFARGQEGYTAEQLEAMTEKQLQIEHRQRELAVAWDDDKGSWIDTSNRE